MHRDCLRRPSPGSVVAVAAMALAATPIADAATRKVSRAHPPVPVPVAHARYADNAGRLNGYRVSYVPKPYTLVPLGADGRFPTTVIPRVASGAGQGPPGPPGPAGPSGLDAPGVVNIVFQANGTSLNPSSGAAEASCKPGTKVLGGGFDDLTRTITGLSKLLPPGSTDEVQENAPFVRNDGTSGWRVRIVNVPSPVMINSSGAVVPNTLPAGSTYFQAFAICG